MLHKSELGEHADRFPSDQNGHVPEHDDHWSEMHFEHGPHDPDEAGISDEERARRTEYLDTQWWPQILAQVRAERENLDQLPGGNPIKRWHEQVMRKPPDPGGIDVEPIE